MPVVEERLSLLEVKMQEVGTTLVRMEGILASVHQMVVALDQRVDRLDQRFDRLDQRIERLDERAVKLFMWVVGIQMTTLIAIVAGLFGIVARLISVPDLRRPNPCGSCLSVSGTMIPAADGSACFGPKSSILLAPLLAAFLREVRPYGRHFQRHPLRGSKPPAHARICHRRRPDAGDRHRRKHGDLQHRGSRHPPAARL